MPVAATAPQTVSLTRLGALGVLRADLVVSEAGQPLLGRPHEWDAALRERGSLLWDGSTLRLWYTGYDGTREGLKQVGHAISTDSGRTWTRTHANPVTPPNLWVEDCSVVRHEGTFHMVAEGRGDQAHRLSSPDGLTWTPHGTLDVRLTTGEPIPPGPFGTPSLVRDDDRWLLFYERRDLGVWVATSRDLQTFTNLWDEAVFEPSESGWDSRLIAFNQVQRLGDHWLATYHGAGDATSADGKRLWANGYASSPDLRHWTRLTTAPVTEPADNLSSLSIVEDPRPNSLFLSFTTHARVERLSARRSRRD